MRKSAIAWPMAVPSSRRHQAPGSGNHPIRSRTLRNALCEPTLAGGTLTNWVTIQQRIVELSRLEKMVESGEVNQLTKKEGLLVQREIIRLENRLSGIRNMKRLPEMVFIVDMEREATAAHEANIKEIPIVAMVDTNCDPGIVDYVIPSNDDAIRAIKLIVGHIADAVIEGRMLRGKEAEEEQMTEETPSTISRKIDEDLELNDEDLLGESTRAKIPAKELTEDLEADTEETENA